MISRTGYLRRQESKGYFFAVGAGRLISRSSEYAADRYAYSVFQPEVLKNAVLNAAAEQKGQWLEYVPLLNVLLITHPPVEFRLDKIDAAAESR